MAWKGYHRKASQAIDVLESRLQFKVIKKGPHYYLCVNDTWGRNLYTVFINKNEVEVLKECFNIEYLVEF